MRRKVRSAPQKPPAMAGTDPETLRIREIHDDASGWRRWGPYLSDRSWGTVREDYSADGDAWRFLPYDLARSKAYRLSLIHI